MAADISSIMQLLQRQAALVPPAYSTVSSPHQTPIPPCPLQPILPITPIQPLSQVSTARAADPQVWGRSSAVPHHSFLQPCCRLRSLLGSPSPCPIALSSGPTELGSLVSPSAPPALPVRSKPLSHTPAARGVVVTPAALAPTGTQLPGAAGAVAWPGPPG